MVCTLLAEHENVPKGVWAGLSSKGINFQKYMYPFLK